MRKLLTICVVLGMASVAYSQVIYEETIDVYDYLVGPGTINWAHTYDHSADPIDYVELIIVADDVDGPRIEPPLDGEQDEVWVSDTVPVLHYLGLLDALPDYTNFNYWPGPGNPDQDLTTTTFLLDPAWINGLPVDVVVEALWGVEIETSTLRIVQMEVEIDIKPGSFPSSINLRKKGVTPVAIHTEPGFDAPTVIDPETALWKPCDAAPVKWEVYDCDELPNPLYGDPLYPDAPEMIGDGDDDLVLYFNTQDLVGGCLNVGDTEATLTFETFTGSLVTATGDVSIVKGPKP